MSVRKIKFVKIIVPTLSTIFIGTFCFSLIELLARRIEAGLKLKGNLEHTYHAELGWLPKKNTNGKIYSFEMDTSFNINSLNLNDRKFNIEDLSDTINILALGDSHTFAIGASTEETWQNRLENILNKTNKSYNVYNAGVIGYSVGQ